MNNNKSESHSIPSSGARLAPGKSCEPDAVLRKGLQPKAEAVRTAKEDVGAHKRAVDKQQMTDGIINGNPKKRERNFWGTEKK